MLYRENGQFKTSYRADQQIFPIIQDRWAVIAIILAAFVLVTSIIVHVYAAIWVKGSVGAMLTGKVSRAWARRHHPGWYKEVGRK